MEEGEAKKANPIVGDAFSDVFWLKKLNKEVDEKK